MSTAEQIVDLIRAEHPKYASRHASSTAEAIALIEQHADTKDEFARVLAPYGYDYMVSATSIPGPGNTIVVFVTLGDFMAACVTADCCGTRERKVLWVLSCGGSDEDGYTHEANQVHQASRALFTPAVSSTERGGPA